MTLATIVVGVTSLILAGGFVQDIVVQLGESIIHSQSGHIQVNRLGFFEAGTRSPEKFLIDEPLSIHQRIGGMEEVEDVLARVSLAGLLSNGRADLAVGGEGVEPDREARLGTHMRVRLGERLADEHPYGIMIGDGVARSLKAEPGDQVTLLVSTAGGALNTIDLNVVGVFQTFSRDFDARAIRIPLRAAHALLDTQGVNTLIVLLKRTEETDKVANRLRHSLDMSKLEVKTWHELSDFYGKTVELYKRQFGVLRLIVLFMVLLSVANSVNMTVMERIGEFGTMMALGNRRRQTLGLIVAESGLLGLTGSALGVALGVALAASISAIGIPMPPPPNSDLGYTARIQIVPSEIVLAFAIGMVATVTASVVPAWRATRTPVVDALRQNA